jgi:nucleotide-binding universal stress UspA family protein
MNTNSVAMGVGPRISTQGRLRNNPPTILFATDFSAHSLAAAQYAFLSARELGAWLTTLHVVEEICAWTSYDQERIEEYYGKWMAEHEPDDLPRWCDGEHRIEYGNAAATIVGTAREVAADLIVIGFAGMGSTDLTTPGTTVLEVIQQAPCPVLVVRQSECMGHVVVTWAEGGTDEYECRIA